MAIPKIDLNLLRVFEAVMQHRSVSGASHELCLTASAVSHALARLRQALDDELFVFGEKGMEPTARALELAPSIRNGLGSIDAALAAPGFVASEAIRTFRIVASDYVTVTVLPRLVARFAMTAPQIDLRVFPANRTDVMRHLDAGRLDFVIGWFDDLPDRLERMTLLREQEAIVVRAGHPLTEGVLTKERLLAFPHVVVDLTGEGAQVADGFHSERGASRRVWLERLQLETNEDAGTIGRAAVSVPHFAAVPPLLQATDMVATLPGRLARYIGRHMPLAILDLPYDPLAIDLEMVWHQRNRQDPGIHWFLGEVVEALAELPG